MIVVDATTGKPDRILRHHTDEVDGVAWSRDGRFLASASWDQQIGLWDAKIGGSAVKLAAGAPADWVAWAPNNLSIAVARRTVIQIWDVESRSLQLTLESPHHFISCLDYSPDGRVVASTGWDNTARVWRLSDGQCVAILPAHYQDTSNWQGIAFHPTLPFLATLDDKDKTICIWRLDLELLLGTPQAPPSTRYTTAKIALVGDGSVGKTSLGHRLVTGEFKSFPRTHGQQFWPYAKVSSRRSDGTECEAILWDLAGQADYRLTHALFVDDADVAMVLFNASDRQQPLKGVEYWLHALRQRREGQCRVILVGAQLDTGDLAMVDSEIDAFCAAQGITGGYVGTSAASGQGLDELVARLAREIPWDAMPATVTTTTFKRIKDFIRDLKAEGSNAAVPLRPAELRALLDERDASFRFSDDELMTAIGHVEDHGYVSILRTSSSEKRILLAPDVLVNLTASIVLEARRNPRGLGALRESDLLTGACALPELVGLADEDQRVLLDAATALFLEHNVCFRERLGSETLLVFPALIHQVKPESDPIDLVEDVSFEISGPTERIYASLVVLLGYTNTFTRTNQWQNQAQYETSPGELCGFRLLAEREGQISLGLYYGATTSSHTRRLFEGLFETFVLSRDVGVVKYPAVVCQACHYRQERAEIVRRIRDKKPHMICAECGTRLGLPKVSELELQPAEQRLVIEERATARRRTTYETALSYVKGLLRDRAATAQKVTCFVSYAWGDRDHERWVATLVRDLLNADIDVVFDQRDNADIGRDIARFLSDGITRSDFIAVVGTPAFHAKYDNRVSTAGSVVAAEVDLIHQRLTASEKTKNTVLPLLRRGERDTSLPPLLRGRVTADFRADEHYFATLLDLVLTLHAVPHSDPAVADLRESLRWDQPPRR